MKRIAIVDDELDNAEVLNLMLTSGGFEAYSFTDPALMLDQLPFRAFDLLILDIAMPDMDGHELFRRVREIDPSIPIVAISANVYPDDIARADATGFVAFFSKPILNSDEFCRDVRRLAGSEP